ncbi:MAG: hypothetical protein JWQ87_5337 [Candidatus Sulfotelmatobacter sp.]|nr:hypothetical protein [Candidatus Sulfotelmatobacter sp.]
MRTDKQIAASRANGAKSRGPITEEGRRAARNRLTHGLFTRSIVLEAESRGHFNELVSGIHAELQPQTAIEHLLVQTMIAAQWRKTRLWSLEKAIVDSASRGQRPAITCGSGLAHYDPTLPNARAMRADTHTNAFFNQQEMRYDRQFHRALNRFHKDRAARLKSESRLEPTDDAKQNHLAEITNPPIPALPPDLPANPPKLPDSQGSEPKPEDPRS